ncbi:hypothetical protein [uncultured Alteromonas sp.]|uniref:hypothetical protein n=1 Tax=uncultured Alteromonas sp. TaxID=179113 RepID=UPI0030EC6A9E|tara:strand:+ start:3032 stop:3799 length:768 start_codon:yes stop_codon:yes gene_type:complete
MTDRVYIGWDVGGWNCDKNSSSRDALVMLDSRGEMFGFPWRGNLAHIINESDNQQALLSTLFALCELDYQQQQTVLAIDTPLTVSNGFRKLLNGVVSNTRVASHQNPYLFRYCERLLADRGFKPLSAVKDMIGAQATKGMHLLAKFIPEKVSTGVWQRQNITAIEAYPSPCKQSRHITDLQNRAQWPLAKKNASKPTMVNGKALHQDHFDAHICALIGWTFQQLPELLWRPEQDAQEAEGWIFVPNDCFVNKELN